MEERGTRYEVLEVRRSSITNLLCKVRLENIANFLQADPDDGQLTLGSDQPGIPERERRWIRMLKLSSVDQSNPVQHPSASVLFFRLRQAGGGQLQTSEPWKLGGHRRFVHPTPVPQSVCLSVCLCWWAGGLVGCPGAGLRSQTLEVPVHTRPADAGMNASASTSGPAGVPYRYRHHCF